MSGQVVVAPVWEQEEDAPENRDPGERTVTNINMSGTDHLSFNAVGLPGFNFVQDPLD